MGGRESHHLLRVLSTNVDVVIELVFSFPVDTQTEGNITLTFRQQESSLWKVTWVDHYGSP